MNKSLIIGLASAAVVGAAVAAAQDAKAPAGTPDAPSSAAGAAFGGPRSSMGMMDEQMRKMQALHERMMRASTPAERQKLMDESRQAMHEGMGMMNQMQGGMMGGGMMGPKGKSADPNTRMQMMSKRIDMMQMMMQMMMDQQGMMGSQGMTASPKSSEPAAKK